MFSTQNIKSSDFFNMFHSLIQIVLCFLMISMGFKT